MPSRPCTPTGSKVHIARWRCRLLTIGMCIFWMPVGLATGGFSPVGAALLLAGTLAVCVSDISLHLTPAAWRTLGILLSLLVLAAFLPDRQYITLMRYERYGIVVLLVLSFVGIGSSLISRGILGIYSALLSLIFG